MAKTITSTREKFIHELADIYDAEALLPRWNAPGGAAGK
jgi:ferritin-like metal-binding protein YciE